ncbi:MAG: hypothetical protein KA254_05340 [Rhodoferax sp.]|nr:hypothetical protein [Rhodoferax sp.]
MSHEHLDTHLDMFEMQLKDLSACLIDADPQAVQAASARLQQVTVDFFHRLDPESLSYLGETSRVRRMNALAASLARVRESLLRHSAYVDRALELVVPAATRKSTYAGSGTYGGPVRQSGAFKVLAA